MELVDAPDSKSGGSNTLRVRVSLRPPKIMKINYRSEIDGLRALAVLPVIFFHAGFELFSGGYVGVDIFFVISGYLITTIILKELHNNTFSIKNFYERRARRILPAFSRVIQSYNALCSINEFYDYMHPKASCMTKITNQIR